MSRQATTLTPSRDDLPRDEVRPPVTRAGTVAAGAARAITEADHMWNSSSVQNAIQVLEQLSDLGRALPFVAPAFVMMSLIIQVERKARDADAKCSDLLDRITFLVHNLEVLRHVKVTDSTKRVIERMNNAIKDAASLIQAYRKQNTLSRRLHVGNRDKFVACAQTVNACANDLMLTLQIQQTSQLDVLTKEVPVDSEDEAAQGFVKRNGGVDKVLTDPVLVAQFAKELHLKIDDDAIRQINTNLSDLMQDNQVRLEHMLRENVGTAVVHGLKELVAQMSEAEREQHFTCVQCDKPFRNSNNGPKSCNFHRAEYDSWVRQHPCCASKNPCQWSSHRATHHCEYPYASFFTYSSKILNYVDTVEKWAEVEDHSFVERSSSQKASIGRLLRLVSKGDIIQEPTVLIRVGQIWHTENYFLDKFTAEDLRQVNDIVRMTGNTTIFRSSPNNSEYAAAEWVLSRGGDIAGVRLIAKAASSSCPFTVVCPIDIATCTKAGDALVESQGGLRAYRPGTPYVLPETVRIGPELSDKPVRATRGDFETRTSPSLPVKLKITSDPPLRANLEFASVEHDNFRSSITIFNNSPSSASEPVTIASVAAFYRRVGDAEYKPVKSLQLIGRELLPLTIDAKRSCTLDVELAIPRSQEDAKLGVKWFNRAFVARKRPIRVKFVFKDIDDEACSLVAEHVFDPMFPLEKKQERDLAFLYFDDMDYCDRRGVHVEGHPDDEKRVIVIGSTAVDVLRLKKIVYQAISAGETEIDMGIGRDYEGTWDWHAWALVDLSCQRVYAFKILLKQGRLINNPSAACLGYVLCPDYGDIQEEMRPIQYAKERISLPVLGAQVEETFMMDDAFDDIVHHVPKPGISSTASASHPRAMVSQELDARLYSIDANLSRIAMALETLVGHLSPAA
ncbi:hypothetical protein OE88DRAFT_1733178 [Heliocybe sulcata]|uniref:Mixed lineage kinase domain-containing protein n=1 Tax=Heliocybe sulcata TaxID=5364 RepID=A0A5C3N9L7_9AGAM|nr:hypothetical protein OE88DRAFT_1733178 [Heliocybe sulcata]